MTLGNKGDILYNGGFIKQVKKHHFILIFFFLIVSAFINAQTAQAIEDLLDLQAVSNQQAAWLVLEASNVSGTGIRSQTEAFRYAIEQNWLPASATANDRIRLDRLSFMIMQAFSIKGGLFYTLIGNPHYAYRELVHRNIITGRIAPGMAVSGDELLFIVNRVLSFQEANIL